MHFPFYSPLPPNYNLLSLDDVTSMYVLWDDHSALETAIDMLRRIEKRPEGLKPFQRTTGD